jgi:dihydroxyacid dehydratase/phosphogluconate dehydratase
VFEGALIKTCVISENFRERYLSTPGEEDCFKARAIVFEGPEDYHERIDDPSLGIDESCLLVVRGCGPVGYPGSAEVVNMQPPASLIKDGIRTLPTMGDGRQSGTAASPSILNISPESAVGGNLARVQVYLDFIIRFQQCQVAAHGRFSRNIQYAWACCRAALSPITHGGKRTNAIFDEARWRLHIHNLS